MSDKDRTLTPLIFSSNTGLRLSALSGLWNCMLRVLQKVFRRQYKNLPRNRETYSWYVFFSAC